MLLLCALCIVWFRFRLFRRYLSFRLAEVPRLYSFLDLVHDGCSGHGPVHASVASARRIGFSWNSFMTNWDRPGLPGLSNLAVLFSIFDLQSLMLGEKRFLLICALLDIRGSHQLLCSSHVRERDKMLSCSIIAGGA